MTSIQNDNSEPLSSFKRRAALSTFSRQSIGVSNRTVITQHLLDAETSLKHLDSEINKLKARIMSLERERQDVVETVETCKSLLAPVNRLPTEVLREIFLFAGPETEVCIDVDRFSSAPIPPTMKISMVCGRWRDIALSLPALWSRLSLYDSAELAVEPQDWDGKPVLRAVKMILERSGNSPLHLMFWIGRHTILHNNMNQILAAFAAESRRWRSVTLQTTSAFLLHPALRQIENNLPILREITLTSDDALSETALAYFRSCPALEIFRTSCLSGPLHTPPLSTVLWAAIHHLEVDDVDGGPTMQDILVACPNLRSLKFIAEGPESDTDPRQEIIESHLESLSIDVRFGEDRHLFDNLRFPRLKSLALTSSPFFPALIWEGNRDLATCLQRSSSNITRFTVGHARLSDMEVLHLLRHMPSLQELHIVEYNDKWNPHSSHLPRMVTSHFSASLRVASTYTPLIPRLTELTAVVDGRGFDTDAFARAIISRWIPDLSRAEELGVACLKSVRMKFMKGFDELPESFLALKCYRDAGMRISIVKGDKF